MRRLARFRGEERALAAPHHHDLGPDPRPRGGRDGRAVALAQSPGLQHHHARGDHRDLRRSAEALRENVGVEAHSVAYPVGYELDADRRRAVAEAGYALGFTNSTGLSRLDRLDPLNIPRVSMSLGSFGALHKLSLLGGVETTRKKRPGGARFAERF